MWAFRISLPTEKKNLSEFIKLSLLIFIRDGGKREHFAFRFVPKIFFSEISALRT